jgi:hypothetical protein
MTNKTKANGALLAYIANRIPGIKLDALIHIVYLIDANYIRENCYPMTWFDWDDNAISADLLDIKNGAFSDYVAMNDDCIVTSRHSGFLLGRLIANLSPYRIQFVDNIINKVNNGYDEQFPHPLTKLINQLDMDIYYDALWCKQISND